MNAAIAAALVALSILSGFIVPNRTGSHLPDPFVAEAQIDGAYFGGYVKPANYKENRRDRRLAKNQNSKRRVVIVVRERQGKTLTFVIRTGGRLVAQDPRLRDARQHHLCR